MTMCLKNEINIINLKDNFIDEFAVLMDEYRFFTARKVTLKNLKIM